MQVVFCRQVLGPAPVHRRPLERVNVDRHDLHTDPSRTDLFPAMGPKKAPHRPAPRTLRVAMRRTRDQAEDRAVFRTVGGRWTAVAWSAYRTRGRLARKAQVATPAPKRPTLIHCDIVNPSASAGSSSRRLSRAKASHRVQQLVEQAMTSPSRFLFGKYQVSRPRTKSPSNAA